MERPDRRLIRVFLSSTFVDFQEERSLLVQQVFPSLRRRARSREVEIVDVDLRWGVTAEQTERGETLPLCLGEIDRCRPYFISLLGERYGWVPPADPTYYRPELLERQPWLRERMGDASLTELEILHGVLRNPDMAGHACFYLRDPAYALARGEPGWVADSPEERQRLAALKEEVRKSGFPVAEGLADPRAIAERIEADLWAVINREYPEQEPPDALEREGRRHSDYRRARTGLYLGGGPAIKTLEGWIAQGEQRILITGESGTGKSALIANWLKVHQQSAPQDLVHAHHLGCTNDASAVRPLLVRLIDTASQVLIQEKHIIEPLKVPENWWELVFKVGELFTLLSSWCERRGRRWILVLDGLDRLAEDDQQVLPWIPTTIPPGVHVLVSALECPARTILQERGYLTYEIGPLGDGEQQQLIERYLNRYTKQLESGLQQKIVEHNLAGSPLFLRVLLEELRQCAWYDTLAEQLEFYLSAESIDGLYGKVLERLERNGHSDATRKSLTALWASRAGLSEIEVLTITGLAPVEWAPVELALEEALGRNGERLVYGHEFLRMAVASRYLSGEGERHKAHKDLANWLSNCDICDERKAEELPWQLQEAGCLDELQEYLANPVNLAYIAWHCGDKEISNYCIKLKAICKCELDELIVNGIDNEIEKVRDDADALIWLVDHVAEVLESAGLYRALYIRLRTLSLELEMANKHANDMSILISLAKIGDAHQNMGNFSEARSFYVRCLDACDQNLGTDHPITLMTATSLAVLYSTIEDYEKAEALDWRCLQARERILGPEHPYTLISLGNLGMLYVSMGDYSKAEVFLTRALEARERLLGPKHPDTLSNLGNLGLLYASINDHEKSEFFYAKCLQAQEQLLGAEHHSTLITVGNLAGLYQKKGDYKQAELYFCRSLDALQNMLGPEHPDTCNIRFGLANLLSDLKRYDESIPLRRLDIQIAKKIDSSDTAGMLNSIHKLADDLYYNGELEECEQLYSEALAGRTRILGDKDRLTTASRHGLANCLSTMERYHEAIKIRRVVLTLSSENEMDFENRLIAMHLLGCDLLAAGETEEALDVLQQCLNHRRKLLGLCNEATIKTHAQLLEALSILGREQEAIGISEALLQELLKERGQNHPDVLVELANQATLHEEINNLDQAEVLWRKCLEGREIALGAEHADTLDAAFNLAEFLSALNREAEAISLRRRELHWCRQQNGDTDPDTLISINQLAIDLHEVGELEEAETLFRELLAGCLQVLEPSDPGIAQALEGLATTLKAAGRLEEALPYAQRALEHRLEHEGPDAWFANIERLYLARILHGLGRNAEAMPLLEALKASLSRLDNPDDEDLELLAEACELLGSCSS